jgi:hypothetical protein
MYLMIDRSIVVLWEPITSARSFMVREIKNKLTEAYMVRSLLKVTKSDEKSIVYNFTTRKDIKKWHHRSIVRVMKSGSIITDF